MSMYLCDQMNDYFISVDWEELMQEANSIEDNWTAFKNEVILVTKRFIPSYLR